MAIQNIPKILTVIDAAKSLKSLESFLLQKKQIVEQERTKRRDISVREATNCLQIIVSACNEYKQIAEQERTKRREIQKWEKETIKKINAQRDLLMKYLDRSFDERAKNFNSLFQLVELGFN